MPYRSSRDRSLGIGRSQLLTGDLAGLFHLPVDAQLAGADAFHQTELNAADLNVFQDLGTLQGDRKGAHLLFKYTRSAEGAALAFESVLVFHVEKGIGLVDLRSDHAHIRLGQCVLVAREQ